MTTIQTQCEIGPNLLSVSTNPTDRLALLHGRSPWIPNGDQRAASRASGVGVDETPVDLGAGGHGGAGARPLDGQARRRGGEAYGQIRGLPLDAGGGESAHE